MGSAGSAEDVGDALLEMQESMVTAEQLGAHLAVVERRLADLAAGAQAYESDQARLSAESASSQRRLAAAESAAREQEGQWRSIEQGEHALFAQVSELQLRLMGEITAHRDASRRQQLESVKQSLEVQQLRQIVAQKLSRLQDQQLVYDAERGGPSRASPAARADSSDAEPSAKSAARLEGLERRLEGMAMQAEQEAAARAQRDAAAAARARMVRGPAAQLAGAVFDALDADRSGFLEEGEGKVYLAMSGAQPDELDYIWADLCRSADKNGDGRRVTS